MKCLKIYNERQRRQFLASKAESMGCHGISYVCNAVGVCRDTLYRGKHELETDANEFFPEGRVRAAGSCLIRKDTLFNHLLDVVRRGLGCLALVHDVLSEFFWHVYDFPPLVASVFPFAFERNLVYPFPFSFLSSHLAILSVL